MATTYRYYLPSFVAASARPYRAARVLRPFVCAECARENQVCTAYVGAADSDGRPYCGNCGHTSEVHR